jgi:dTDP-4-dehydrorhamnose reductase
MTRWLVTGAAGMLGRELVGVLAGHGAAVSGQARGDLDVTDAAAVRAAVAWYRPDVVVNCAAWTDVDAAEEHEQAALAVNGVGPRHLAAACAQVGARLVQVSTDYVFGGDQRVPYAESDRPAPRTAYGRTKLAGERAVLELLPDAALVVRTAWLYGGRGPSFVHTMIALERARPLVEVVADEFGQPTWTADVAAQIIALAEPGVPPGIYHATSGGQASRHDLAREVFRLLGADPSRVRATSTAAFRPAARARRPAWSVLGHSRHALAGIEPIGDWHDALRRSWPALRVASRASRRGEQNEAG